MTEHSRSARVARALVSDATGFDFVQAVRLLHRVFPGRAPIGGWEDPSREVVRFRVPPSLGFPPSEIASLTLPDAESDRGPSAPAQMAVRFLGLTGPQGVLPHVYTEYAAARARLRDTAFRDFLDLFHHRILSLYYRVWERRQTAAAAERGQEDRLRAHLLDLAGAGTPAVQAQSVLPVDAMAYYAGLLAMGARPAEGLAQMVRDHFSVDATVEQFVGDWQPLRHGGQVCLGAEDADSQLGAAIVGDAVFDPLSRVRLRLGPLTRAQFDAFLPGGRWHAALTELARLYTDAQLGVEAQLVLARDEIPAARLGAPESPVLGFGTWLRAKPPRTDADDVRLSLC